MTYGSQTAVEDILGIDANTDTTRITRALAGANDYIDSRLDEAGETPPLSSPPDIIIQIANTLAAGICKDEAKNPSEETADRISGRNRLTNRAYEWLAQYLCAEYDYQCAQAASGGGGGGTIEPVRTSSGSIASSDYKTHEMKERWDEE